MHLYGGNKWKKGKQTEKEESESRFNLILKKENKSEYTRQMDAKRKMQVQEKGKEKK